MIYPINTKSTLHRYFSFSQNSQSFESLLKNSRTGCRYSLDRKDLITDHFVDSHAARCFDFGHQHMVSRRCVQGRYRVYLFEFTCCFDIMIALDIDSDHGDTLVIELFRIDLDSVSNNGVFFFEFLDVFFELWVGPRLLSPRYPRAVPLHLLSKLKVNDVQRSRIPL